MIELEKENTVLENKITVLTNKITGVEKVEPEPTLKVDDVWRRLTRKIIV